MKEGKIYIYIEAIASGSTEFFFFLLIFLNVYPMILSLLSLYTGTHMFYFRTQKLEIL